MGADEELAYSQELGAIKGEVHSMKGEVNSIKGSVNKLFEKFDLFVEKMQPKQMGIPAIVGLLAAVLGIFALLFGSVIYITNSSNAPLYAQNAQIVATLQAMQNSSQHNTNLVQLASKDISGLSNKVSSNEETLRWMIFEENIPKKLTSLKGEVNTLKMQMENIMQFSHKGKTNGIP